MKTKEELIAIKEEVENLNNKLVELTEEELLQVSGGSALDLMGSDAHCKNALTKKPILEDR